MHVFNTNGSAVRIAQNLVDIAELGFRLSAKTTGFEGAIKIPKTQAMIQDIEIRVRTLAVFERVDIGHEVSANAIGVNHFLDAGCFAAIIVVVGVEINHPANWLIRNTKVGKNFVIETASAKQKLVNLL
ncbi:unannotated protein [freshwater metagenome]|uniref:Unannotated protein n=1 Tax=freshwater metagenome TaxID=449393 RepID=A0A6J6H0P2_9ZZZZ